MDPDFSGSRYSLNIDQSERKLYDEKSKIKTSHSKTFSAQKYARNRLQYDLYILNKYFFYTYFFTSGIDLNL